MRELLATVLMVRSDRRSWLPPVVWSLVAIVSLSVATWVALQPGRLADLRDLRAWLSFVYSPDGDPRPFFERELIYPPIALFVLSPLGAIPEAQLAQWFLPVAIAVTMLAGWVFVQAIGNRLHASVPIQQRIAIVGLLLSGGGVRGTLWLGKVVALAVLFGALALLWSRRRPFLAALALALCAFKPHLAVGFGLAILLLDGFDVPVMACAIVVLLSLAVGAATNASVLAMIAGYAQRLAGLYDSSALLLYAATAIAALVLLSAAANWARDEASRAQVLAAALMLPLLVLPNELFTSLMVAPAVWLLIWPEGRLIRREPVRLAVVAALVLWSVLDLPRLMRLVARTTESGPWLHQISFYGDPLRLTVLFAIVLYAALRRSRGATFGRTT